MDEFATMKLYHADGAIIWKSFDLTPEMLTHTRVVDLKTWQLTEQWEQSEWVDPPVELLTDYITKMRERVYEHYTSGYTRRETVDKVKMQDFFEVSAERRGVIERRIRGSVERVYDEFKKGTLRRRR